MATTWEMKKTTDGGPLRLGTMEAGDSTTLEETSLIKANTKTSPLLRDGGTTRCHLSHLPAREKSLLMPMQTKKRTSHPWKHEDMLLT
jgi:hypothetical protein